MIDIYTILSSKPHNPHYLKRYIKFILWCQKVNKDLDECAYTEKHHICPKAKSMFPYYSNFKEFEWNLIKLTASQHFISHHILAKAYNNRSMIGAFIRLIRSTNRNHRSYSILRKRMSEEMKINNPMFDPDTRNKMITSILKTWTPDRLKQNSENKIGKTNITESGRKRLSELWLGISKGPMSQSHKDELLVSCCKFIYITPYGEFISSTEAGKVIGVSGNAIRKRCINNNHIIKNSRSLEDKTLIGKTWLDVGYSRRSKTNC